MKKRRPKPITVPPSDEKAVARARRDWPGAFADGHELQAEVSARFAALMAEHAKQPEGLEFFRDPEWPLLVVTGAAIDLGILPELEPLAVEWSGWSMERLESIVIPYVEFKDTTFRDCLDFLCAAVRATDGHGDFRIYLDEVSMDIGKQVLITVSFTHIPALELLRYITGLNHAWFRTPDDRSGVSVQPLWVPWWDPGFPGVN